LDQSSRAGAVGGPIAARNGKLGELLRDLQVRGVAAAHRSGRSIYSSVFSTLNSDFLMMPGRLSQKSLTEKGAGVESPAINDDTNNIVRHACTVHCAINNALLLLLLLLLFI
jgi:hypothetical protein